MRSGTCLQCGSCCELAIRCPWFTADRLCKVYYRPCRPSVCMNFPIDHRDIEDVWLSSGRHCGYFFVKEQR
ncbi:MAG TPA: hypothetical protein PKM59_02270 [Thermodesulfobacteriota bacterium]|nr:hypothetical protein [Thermodesulfobacteriota bacterium]HNU71262.1 hypothetical protein [Thermodesulfobacteriota bacterium]